MLQGIWKPRKIENPDYFEDKEPFKMTPIVSMGFYGTSSKTQLMERDVKTSEKS